MKDQNSVVSLEDNQAQKDVDQDPLASLDRQYALSVDSEVDNSDYNGDEVDLVNQSKDSSEFQQQEGSWVSASVVSNNEDKKETIDDSEEIIGQDTATIVEKDQTLPTTNSINAKEPSIIKGLFSSLGLWSAIISLI